MARRLRHLLRGGSFQDAARKSEARMRTFLGLGIIVLGIFLLVAGWESNDSLSSRFSRMFHGSPSDRTIWYLIGGVVALAVGASLALNRRRPKTG